MRRKPLGEVQFFSDAAAQQHLADWLFLETLDDLRRRIPEPRGIKARYQLLGIAPLLRKLLLDGDKTLLHKVRRASKDRPLPMFRADSLHVPSGPEGRVLWVFGLTTSPESEIAPLSLDQFLKLRAGHILGEDVSVDEVIRHYANVEGGVHLGRSKTRASDLMQLAMINPPVELPLHIEVLASIAFVVVQGLRELENVVRADYIRRTVSPRPEEIEPPGVRMGLTQ